MDAAARWLRDNDPEYEENYYKKRRRAKKNKKAMAKGNPNRSNTRRQMRGVVKENLNGKNIAKSPAKPNRNG